MGTVHLHPDEVSELDSVLEFFAGWLNVLGEADRLQLPLSDDGASTCAARWGGVVTVSAKPKSCLDIHRSIDIRWRSTCAHTGSRVPPLFVREEVAQEAIGRVEERFGQLRRRH